PVILAIGAATPILDLVRLSRSERVMPVMQRALLVVRVDISEPPISTRLLECRAGVFIPASAEVRMVAVAVSGPDVLRNHVHEQSIARLAFAEPFEDRLTLLARSLLLDASRALAR